MFDIGKTFVVAAYRGEQSEAFIGRVERVRDLETAPVSSDTLRRNPAIARSRFLVTFVDLDSPAEAPKFKSLYDGFITLSGVGP